MPSSPEWPYLHELQVLVGQLALGELVFLGDPWVLQHLLSCEALVGVHMQHLGHQVLGGHSKQEGWWEELAGEPRLCPTGEKWTRRPSPTISCLNPCRSPCDPCSRSFQGLPKHMPFFGTSWNILSFLFHLLEATQEGGENLRLGSGRLRFKT